MGDREGGMKGKTRVNEKSWMKAQGIAAISAKLELGTFYLSDLLRTGDNRTYNTFRIGAYGKSFHKTVISIYKSGHEYDLFQSHSRV